MEKDFSKNLESPFQKEKQERMRKLKSEIKKLDKSPEEKERKENQGEYVVKYDQTNDKFYVNRNKQKIELTLGDIAADYAWGIKYVPDEKMPEKMYYRLKKRIEINEARRDIEKIHDRELTETEHLPNYEKDQYKAGRLAEIMVRELMTRIQFLPGMEFQIQRASIEEDFRQKIDFKIILRQHKRGVRVEGKETDEITSKTLAIQFTTDEALQLLKERRIARMKEKYGKELDVDDIIVVAVSLNRVREIFEQWKMNQKLPGGPEKLLSKEEKIKIFKGITRGMVEISTEKLEKMFSS